MRVGASWLLGCGLLAGALACDPRAAGSPGELRAHLETEPATLDPLLTTDDAGLTVQGLLFTPLLGLDADLSPVPGIARAWSVSSDLRADRFDLDPAATFHGGRPVTASDVAFTIGRIRDPSVPRSRGRRDFEDLADIEQAGPHRITVRFRAPYSGRLLAFNLPIVPAHVLSSGPEAARGFGRRPVGNGPFRFVRWETGRAIHLTPRGGNSAGLTFVVLTEPATWLEAGRRGDLHDFRIPNRHAAAAQRDPQILRRFRLLDVSRLAQTSVTWNCLHPAPSDARVRRALGRVIPRDRIIASLFGGRTRPVSGPYPAAVPENASDLPPLPFDPAAAAAEPVAAGYVSDGTTLRRAW